MVEFTEVCRITQLDNFTNFHSGEEIGSARWVRRRVVRDLGSMYRKKFMSTVAVEVKQAC
ncbi:hypothetical protein CRM22_007129, partial [Opisthorchis felineus]